LKLIIYFGTHQKGYVRLNIPSGHFQVKLKRIVVQFVQNTWARCVY